MTSQREDINLTPDHIQSLSSDDRLAEFFSYLRYPIDDRLEMTPEALQLNANLTNATRRVERLVSVEAGALQIFLFELTSVTVAHTRALARAFRNRAGNFLLVLTDDYQRIDFVLLERELPGLTDNGLSRRSVIVRPRILSVDRRDPNRVDLRVLRRFTFTEFDENDQPDPYAQYDKLSSAYAVAEWSEPLFNNRALFSDYYLNERLPEHPSWEDEDRNRAFLKVRKEFAQARRRFAGEDAATVRQELIQPLLETLGFRVESGPGGNKEDFYLRTDDTEQVRAFVLAYPWNRYLDGKDASRDDERPEENPGAQVVSLLDSGAADWGIVTNGKLWRLYSARAHSRATNYYEISLEETLASPDPGEAFRYFYLFFRAEAFAPQELPVAGETRELTFLDWLMEESQAYARELGERLKDRVFEKIFPHFAEGFIEGLGGTETLLDLPQEEREAQLELVYEGTLTFLYRLLFLLYAESRDLLPVREVRGYYQLSLRRLKEEIAEQAGPLEDQVATRLDEAYDDQLPSDGENILYDRLLDLFEVIDRGSTARNVPVYNGGLFITNPEENDTGREAQAARFLDGTKLPDRYLALGLDRLARDVDPKRLDLGFIDYKSLGVRQLGSIYEGLLEFKVRVAAEKMAVVEGKRTEEVMPYTDAVSEGRKILTQGRGVNAAERTYLRGAVYLENDRRERKATGSYYTPDYIVKYIVRHTVGPVLDEKLVSLRPHLQDAERRFHASIKRKREVEGVTPDEPAILQDIAGDVLYDLFDVKILDPAMGSGHFLVEAVDYVTDRLVRFLDGFPFLGVFLERMRRSILHEMEQQQVTVDPTRLTDVTLLKRHVLKRCIYGADLNPMAVELAKVSLWLDCFTLGAPLSFLNHHLRIGNSLIGAMAQDVEEEMGGATPEGQSTFLTGPFVRLLQAAGLMQTLAAIADVTMEQVHESKTLFDRFEENATPYKRLLDIHVARHFGVERAEEFLALYGPEVMQTDSDELEQPYREVMEQTRSLYEEKRFFHWDLEFPEVFIDLEAATWKADGGFDAVVGNPPYVSAWSMTEDDPTIRSSVEALSPHGEILGAHWDLYIPFLLKAHALARNNGRFSFIIPNPFCREKYATQIRKFLLEHTHIQRIVSFGEDNVFHEVSRQTLVPIIFKQKPKLSEVKIKIDSPYSLIAQSNGQAERSYREVPQSVFHELPGFQFRHEVDAGQFEILEKVDEYAVQVGNLCYVNYGVQASSREKGQFGKAEMVSESPQGDAKKFFEGKNVSRYRIDWPGLYLNYQPDAMYGPRAPELFKSQKIVIRHVSAENDSLLVAYDEEGLYCDHGLILAVEYKNIAESTLRLEFEGFPQLEKPYSLTYLLAVISSRLESFYYGLRFATGSLQGSYSHVYPQHVRALPVRRINFTTSKPQRERLVAKLLDFYENSKNELLLKQLDALIPRIETGGLLAFQPDASGGDEKSDVVHDLLAHLAEKMVTMNKQKQQREEAFWDDLVAIIDASTFDTLRNKGKWEQSLAKDPACRAYVDPESRSTRHLDESLGWDEECFATFAGMLAGQDSVTPPLLEVYRRHHPDYKTLIQRIVATDDLIDQIVYRLYGLTEEEIAVVEGEAE